MKHLLPYILLGFLWSACNSKGASFNQMDKQDNYVIILDLSDRLLSPNQTDIDTSVIRACFEKFEAGVQKRLTVKSRDKFVVRIIPQRGSPLPVNQFENRLSLDLGSVSAAEKLKVLNSFKSQIGSTIKDLYQKAYLGDKTSSYSGVDIWQYFNEQLNTDIDATYNNKVTVITDGYFDFEDKSRGLNNANQSTISKVLLAKMKGGHWKEKAEKENVGIIPVRVKGDARLLVVGIQSKTPNDLSETDKLTYLWDKWVRQSGALLITTPIANASSGKLKRLIKETL